MFWRLTILCVNYLVCAGARLNRAHRRIAYLSYSQPPHSYLRGATCHIIFPGRKIKLVRSTRKSFAGSFLTRRDNRWRTTSHKYLSIRARETLWFETKKGPLARENDGKRYILANVSRKIFPNFMKRYHCAYFVLSRLLLTERMWFSRTYFLLYDVGGKTSCAVFYNVRQEPIYFVIWYVLSFSHRSSKSLSFTNP